MLEFTLSLTSAAEPGTGLGTELVDDRFPRDPQGRPTLPGSHLKGLLRQQWQRMAPFIGIDKSEALEDTVFGTGFSPDTDLRAEATSLRLPDLVIDDQQGATNGILAARTAIHSIEDGPGTGSEVATGTAKANSLRITEAIPAGTRFRGRVSWLSADPRAAAVVRLCLLTLEAVGGSRQRGCGRCVVTLDEPRPDNPAAGSGDPIAEQLAAIRQPSEAKPEPQTSSDLPGTTGAAEWYRLDFAAREPVLCPEHPDAANHLEGAAAIPASAVLGAIVSRVASLHGADAATALRASPSFRAGPLVPAGFKNNHGLATVAPLSLRIAKDPEAARAAGKRVAFDELLEPSAREEVPAPKALTGSLVIDQRGDLHYCRAADLPRLVRAQVGLDESRRTNREQGPQLYSIEAIGPCRWSGVLALPVGWKGIVDKALAEVAFGRRRAHFGGGVARLEPWAPAAPLSGNRLALVAQAPIKVDDYESLAGSDRRNLPDPVATLRVAVEAWIARHRLPLAWREGMASLAVRFGWNRHRKGLQEPALVLVPGSIAVLELKHGQPLATDRLTEVLAAGLGDGREDGFGTVLPHPGTTLIGPVTRPQPEPTTLPESDPLLAWALGWARRVEELPSPSQVAQVITLVEGGKPERVTEFLRRQEQRPRFQDDLDALKKDLLGQGPPGQALVKIGSTPEARRLADALRTVQDIAITLREKADAP